MDDGKGPDEGRGVVAVCGIDAPATGVRAGEGLWGTIPSEEGPGDGEGEEAGRTLLGVDPGAAEDGAIIP